MLDKKPESLAALIEGITPEIYASLKRAVELGKWDNGQPLTREQTEHTLQAIIAYEHRHVPVDRRTGFINPEAVAQTHCNSRKDTIASDRDNAAGESTE